MWYIVLSRETGKQELQKLHTDAHRKWLADHTEWGESSSRDRPQIISMASIRAHRGPRPFSFHGVRNMEVLEWNPLHAFRLEGPTLADIERMASKR